MYLTCRTSRIIRKRGIENEEEIREVNGSVSTDVFLALRDGTAAEPGRRFLPQEGGGVGHRGAASGRLKLDVLLRV